MPFGKHHTTQKLREVAATADETIKPFFIDAVNRIDYEVELKYWHVERINVAIEELKQLKQTPEIRAIIRKLQRWGPMPESYTQSHRAKTIRRTGIVPSRTGAMT